MSETKNILDNCTDCEACVKNCLFLREHCDSPREIARELFDHPTAKMERTYSCDMCELCLKVCPEDLNPAKMFRETRRDAFKVVDEKDSGELYDFMSKRFTHLRSHQHFSTSAIFTSLKKGQSKKVERLFFPGCSLPAYSPDLVIKTWGYLTARLPDTGLLLNCCGKPTYELGDLKAFDKMREKLESEIAATGAREIITACPECHYVFSTLHKNIRVTSLYETIVQNGIPEPMHRGGGKVTVHDSCNARHNAGMQNAVRDIAKAAGYELFEMKHKKGVTMCCGGGGCAPFGDCELAESKTRLRVKEAKGHTIASYCGFCRERFAAYGPSLHILDLLFNDDCNNGRDKRPSHSWLNWIRRGYLKLR